MSYCTLTENTAYLHELGIGADATDMVTAAEKTKAEAYADAIIHEKLGTIFEQVGGLYPPAIVDIAEMIASAQLYRFVYSTQLAQGAADSPESSPSWNLEKRGIARLDKIAAGGYIVASDGTWVEGYGPTDGAGAPSSIEEEDEDAIFDLRAEKPGDLRSPEDAYGWEALNGVDD